jgi:hypothetical protein
MDLPWRRTDGLVSLAANYLSAARGRLGHHPGISPRSGATHTVKPITQTAQIGGPAVRFRDHLRHLVLSAYTTLSEPPI